MTKYLLNLVCIIGIAGAAHAGDVGVVANLEITEDGHAYIVFFDGDSNPATDSQLAGYSIEDTRAEGSAITFSRPAAPEAGTGQFATAWASLDSQGPLAGEEDPGAGPGAEDWFFDGDPEPTYFLGEGNIHGYMVRDPGTPIYIGQIIDTGPTGLNRNLVEADFPDMGGFVAGGHLEFTEFKATDATNNSVKDGDITLRTAAPLAAGSTSIAGTKYSQTGGIGLSGTDFDAAFISTDKIVMDLKVDVAGTGVIDGANTVTTTKFYGAASGFGDATPDGHIMVNGKVVEIQYADLVETVVTASGDFVSAHLRIQALDGAATIAVDADLTQTGIDAVIPGRWGTLGSTMVVSLVPGDFDLDNDCDADDIDAISELLRDPAITADVRSLLFDVDGDYDVDADDRLFVIENLVARTNGTGTVMGDIQLDGLVDSADYTLWADNFGGPITDGNPAEPVRGWIQGDLNGDGESDSADYTLWADNFGTGPRDALPNGGGQPAPVPTPEPATMMLLAIGGLTTIVRRRRNK